MRKMNGTQQNFARLGLRPGAYNRQYILAGPQDKK
jgi:hypothetical protein